MNFPNNKLSAKKFVKNKTYKIQFNKILTLCLEAHSQLIKNEKNLENLEEETLRNKLLKYIKRNQGRYNLAKYVFSAETPEIDENTDKTVGYHDIKITIPCSTSFSIEEQKEFIIECKRLDGYSNKNQEYIKKGMDRFIFEKYTCKLDVCGMIGFIEKSKKSYGDSKITEIVNDINNKLVNKCGKSTAEKLMPESNLIKNGFLGLFKSTHIRQKCKLPINISHLFLDNEQSITIMQ